MNEEKKQVQSTICSNCGGQLDTNGLSDTIECPFCGTKYSVSDLLNESDAVRIEKIKSKTYKELESDKIKREIEKEKNQEEMNKIQSFKKSKFSKFLLVCAIVSGLFTLEGLSGGSFICGIIALIQTALYAVSWMMGRGIIKEKKPNSRNMLTALSFILIIPFMIFSGYATNNNKNEKIDWNTIVLSEQLPKPKSKKGRIVTNSDEELSMYIAKSSLNDYNEYIEECNKFGFTVDEIKDTSSYNAFDDEGYKLTLQYSESNKEFQINLETPLKLEKIKWPASVIAGKLPVPKSEMGKIDYESADSFAVYIGKISKADYDEYVNECISKGFNIDYHKNKNTYYGDNADGFHVSVDYKGNQLMYIDITAPDNWNSSATATPNVTAEPPKATSAPKTTDIPKATEAPKNETKNTNTSTSDGISEEFKTSMDSYEKFFDEYIAIMKKYSDNPNDLSTLADYTKYMGQYAKMISDFEKWESKDLNAAETAYYIEVQARINQKLLAVAQ